MSAYLPKAVQDVIEQFERLPGVGPKSAARMAYHYLRSSNGEAVALANALQKMESEVVNCTKCFNVSDSEICDVCASPIRDLHKLCLVEEPLDVVALEKSSVFNGLYFVLGGVISPADGIGAEELRFNELRNRVLELISAQRAKADTTTKISGVNNEEEGADAFQRVTPLVELIIATNPSLEGEATANHTHMVLREFVKSGELMISRLAMGLPTGADLEYADRNTLKKSLEGRTIL